MRWSRASVRARTTAGAVLVVAVALLVGAAVLVLVVRSSLHEGAESAAEQRADELAAQVARSGPPATVLRDDRDGEDEDEDDDVDPEDVVWQILDRSGAVVSESQPLGQALRVADGEEIAVPDGDGAYIAAVSEATWRGEEYDVLVAVSLEDVADTTEALVPPLLIGLPLLLLVVGGTAWLVVSRALGPVERIRREVEQITGDRLDRRVPEPSSHDEVQRLAHTMNQMLGRLQSARDRQQDFIADASHELRSPLASLRQTAEVARAHPAALPEGELLDAVFEESARMQVLVDQLLVLARAGEGRSDVGPADVDLDDLALHEAARLPRDRLTVDTTAVGAGRVRGDTVALGQVVRNLVANAVRHATAHVAVTVQQAGDEVILVVEDDGSGIPGPDRERVFERFVRLDEARAREAGGSGLGLAIVREVVTNHGGSVGVESSPLGGARFVVRLPAAG